MRNENGINLRETTSGPYAFLWAVSIKGYKLLDKSTHKAYANPIGGSIGAVDDCSPWLVCLDNMGRRYPPLAKPTLHRKFARLHSDGSIIGFANKYGLLGAYDVLLAPCGGGETVLGESLERWRTETRNMGCLLAVWDLVQEENVKKLREIIDWPLNDRGVQTYDCVRVTMQAVYDDDQKKWQVSHYRGEGLPQPGYSAKIEILSLRGSNIHTELLKRWQVGQWIEPAKYYVCREVNKQLEGHVSPQVLPFLEDKIYLFPDSLLTALWVMFLMEIMGNVRVRQCDFCHEWKEVKTNRDRFYCDNACRQAAFRERKRKHQEEDSCERTRRKVE